MTDAMTNATTNNPTTPNDAVLSRLIALESMDRDALLALWLKLYGSECPKHSTRKYLIARLSYRIQELAYSGLSANAEARLAAHAKQYCVKGKIDYAIKPGDVLKGIFQGIEHQALALEDGTFQYDGRKFNSLSAVAVHITGMSWSGPAFFDLKKRKAKML